MPKSEKIEKIITKYLSKSTTKKDLDKLLDALKSESTKELFKSYIKTNYLVDYHMKDFQTEEEKEKLFKLLNSNTKILKKKKQFQFLKYAALFAVLVSLASYYWISKKNFNMADDVIVSQEQSVLPGSSKAILTLEDGSDIVLHKDSVYTNTNSSAVKNKLIYSKKTSEELAQVKYNSLTVPRGGQYYVKLADGTAVWINSDSQLKYPTSFKSGETRKVELVYGEAYFDVSPSTEHNGSRFKVLSKYQEVEVLGTEFNIKAYNDESYVYTTLVEGKVSLTANAKQDILKPNEQVTFNVDTKEYAKNIVDVYDVTSWKNGVFSFKRKPLKEITKVLSRWYNVDFKFTNKEIEDVKFMGVVSKDSPLEDILLSIKNSGFIKSYQIDKTSVTLN